MKLQIPLIKSTLNALQLHLPAEAYDQLKQLPARLDFNDKEWHHHEACSDTLGISPDELLYCAQQFFMDSLGKGEVNQDCLKFIRERIFMKEG